MRKTCLTTAMIAAAVTAFAIWPSLVGAHRTRPQVVFLAKFKFVGQSWGVISSPERRKGHNAPCVFLAQGQGFTSHGERCGLPKIEERGFRGADGRPRILRVFAFPSKVVRVDLGLGPLGHRSIPLHLLTKSQAEQAKVPRFRWGFSRVIGNECYESITALGASGEVIYEAHDSGGTPCEPVSPWL
jgi:hypothetical protein